MGCRYCSVVNAVCFWGPMPEKRWKRPGLLVVSLLLGGGFSIALALTWSNGIHPLVAALVVALVSACLLGVLVALKGCDACVARLFGNAI